MAPRTHTSKSADALTAFAIEGPQLDEQQKYMHLLFQHLTMAGDGKRVFVVRRVCKTWQAYVDNHMENGHWAMLHACTVDDLVLQRFMLERSVKMYEQTESDMKASFRAVISGNRAAPGVYLLLNLCKQIAIDTASNKKQRFALAFDNELRGLAYYAVWRATHTGSDEENGIAGDESNGDDDEWEPMEQLTGSTPPPRMNGMIKQLKRWFGETTAEVRAQVAHRMVDQPASAKLAAEMSVRSFVDMMSAIPFHACRLSNEFRQVGLARLQRLDEVER